MTSIYLPNDYDPLYQRILEVTEEGLGVDVNRLIAEGTLSGNTARAELDPRWSRDALKSTQIIPLVTKVDNGNVIDAMRDFQMFNIEVTVTLILRLHSEIDRTEYETVKKEILNLSNKTVQILRNGSNLQNTEDGLPTGLSSGLLEFKETNEPDFNWEERWVSIENVFTGHITLNQGAVPALPINVVPPLIIPSGSLVNSGTLLITRPGTWIDANTISYQWYRSGSSIAGENLSYYTVTGDDVDLALQVDEIACNSAGCTSSLSNTLIPAYWIGEYDEGLVAFDNSTQESASFNFVFSGNPDAVILTIESGTLPNENINVYGLSFNSASLTIQTSAAISGNIRYRAAYSTTYPALVSSSLEPGSGAFHIAAGSVTSSLAVFTASYTASFTGSVDLFFASVWDEDTNYDANVFVTNDIKGDSQSTGHLSAPIDAGTKIHFISVDF